VANVIKAKVMEHHCIPIPILKLTWDMPGHIVVYFRKVLTYIFSSMLRIKLSGSLTATKKLDVPSTRSNVFGNSLSQVSSPYMTIFPSFCRICASHVSCVARVDEVSDSAKFKITSKKDGIEPVVIALIRGIVMVGDVACAVKGIAAPLDMRLEVAKLAMKPPWRIERHTFE
jgi:hypothetical protein